MSGKWTVIEQLFESRLVAEIPCLLRYARALTHDEIAAEDLVQDALLLACQKRDSFNEGCSLRNWLLAILHNRFIDDCRRLKVERDRDRRLADAAKAIAPGQDETVRLALLARALGALPAEQRSALRLVAVDGLSYREAAARLNIPMGTVMSRLSRARAALRAIGLLPPFSVASLAAA